MGSIVRRNLSPHLMQIAKDNRTHNSSASIDNQHWLLLQPAPFGAGATECIWCPYGTRTTSIACSLSRSPLVRSRLCLLIMYPCVLWSIQFIEQMKIRTETDTYIVTSAICFEFYSKRVDCVLFSHSLGLLIDHSATTNNHVNASSIDRKFELRT